MIDKRTYGIDATEVTRAQYARFVLERGSDTSGQPVECAWNTSFEPTGGWPVTDRPQHPVTNVDWCDAYAYCKAVGKRLCGRIGGGPNPFEKYNDASTSQWYNACTSGGLHPYPYGDHYTGMACNGLDRSEGSALPVGSIETCTSTEQGYSGIFDLCGNVDEWEDSCDQSNGMDICGHRGGGYHDIPDYISCGYHGMSDRKTVYATLGFRCCTDALCGGALCDSPPASFCTDGSHQEKYSAYGSCVDEVCVYSHETVFCALGCESGTCHQDPCAGVSCEESVPDDCANDSTLLHHDVPGTCHDGKCEYQTYTEECPAPPADECLDASTLLAHQSTCTAGVCGSESHTVVCAYGCQAGACKGTPCGSDDCAALEECYDQQWCVAKSVTVDGGYAIDATETTRSQYAAWLATQPSTTGQAAWCEWNTSFAPELQSGGVACDGMSWPPANHDEHPMSCVDWCDAFAFCKAVGKRLCGRIGGGANGYDDLNDANKSQWYRACSSGGTHVYPYGDLFEPHSCNGLGNGVMEPMAVGACSGCTSMEPGYTGIYDLSGNLREMEDSCNQYAGPDDACRARGGVFAEGGDQLRCESDPGLGFARVGWDAAVGFRCCSDP